jgi:hypothetical protein
MLAQLGGHLLAGGFQLLGGLGQGLAQAVLLPGHQVRGDRLARDAAVAPSVHEEGLADGDARGNRDAGQDLARHYFSSPKRLLKSS